MQLQGLYPSGATLTGKSAPYYDTSTWNIPQFQPPAGGMQSPTSLYSQFSNLVPPGQTAGQMTQAALGADSMLPANLQIGAANSLLSPQAMQQFQQQYQQQYAAPAEAQLGSQIYGQGRADSTFGGAQMGQMKSSDLFNSVQAGASAYQNAFNNFLGLRQSFFGNEGQMAQSANNANMQRDMGLANLSAQTYNNQSNNQNNYNLQAYQSMLQAQNQRENMQQQQIQNVGQDRGQDRQWQMQFSRNLPKGGGDGGNSGGMSPQPKFF